MSKLAKAIDAVWTGDTVAARSSLNLNYTDIKVKAYDVHEPGHYRVYDINASFGARKVIDSNAILNTKSLDSLSEETLKDIKRAIIEEVFGEFRQLLIEMRVATYDQDNNRMRSLLTELEEQMFYDGI